MTRTQKTIAAIKIGKRQMMELADGKVVKAIILTVVGIILAIPALVFSKKTRDSVKLGIRDITEEIEGA